MGQKHTLKPVSLRSALFGMPEPLLHNDSRAPAPYGHSPNFVRSSNSSAQWSGCLGPSVIAS